MDRFKFLLVLYFTLQSTYSIRIIYREASSPDDIWYDNADWFNISFPRCTSDTTDEIQAKCENYGAKKCASNLPCSCTCPKSNSTVAFDGDKWQCTSYAEMKNRSRCRYRFSKEHYFNQTIYLPTNYGEIVVIFITGTNGSCTINMTSSKYLTCNTTWSPIIGLDGTTNETFHLKYHIGDLYTFKIEHNESDSLRGKLIKLGINCNTPTGGDGEPCVMFKLRGYTDCGQDIFGESSCKVNTLPVSQYSPQMENRTLVKPTSLQTPIASYTGSVSVGASSSFHPVVLYSISDTSKGLQVSTAKPKFSYTVSVFQPNYLTSSSTMILNGTLITPINRQQKVCGDNNLLVIAAVAFLGGMLFIVFVELIVVAICRRKRSGSKSGKRNTTKHKPTGDVSFQANLESNCDLPHNTADVSLNNHGRTSERVQLGMNNLNTSRPTNSLYQELVVRPKKGTQVYQSLAFEENPNTSISSDYVNVKKHFKHHQPPLFLPDCSVPETQINHSYINVAAIPLGIKPFGTSSAVSVDSSSSL